MRIENLRNLNTEAMAYMGDAVYEQAVREKLLREGHLRVDNLHRMAVRYVKAEAQAKAIKEMFSESRILIVTGILKDKDVDRILRHMREMSGDFIVTRVDNPRAMSAQALADKLERLDAGRVTIADDPIDSIREALKNKGSYDVILFAGSLYLIGEIRRRYVDERKKS